MFTPFKPAAVALIALANFASAARAQTTISTLPANNTFGTAYTIIGQTFTTPDDNVLTNFSLQLFGIRPLTMSVFAYNDLADTIVGGALFTSVPTEATLVGGLNGYSFDLNGLNLTTGQTYAALVRGTTTFNGRQTVGAPDAYAGGKFIIGTNLVDPFTPWESLFGGKRDLAFTATFSSAQAIPEPASWALLASVGVPTLIFFKRRKTPRE